MKRRGWSYIVRVFRGEYASRNGQKARSNLGICQVMETEEVFWDKKCDRWCPVPVRGLVRWKMARPLIFGDRKVMWADWQWRRGGEARLEGLEEGIEVRKWKRFAWHHAYCCFPFVVFSTPWLCRLWFFKVHKDIAFILINLFEYHSEKSWTAIYKYY